MTRILTGDRPTGKLHLGHYLGSLSKRVEFQNLYEQYVLIADVQAMTDNWEHPEILKENIFHIALDYLAAGIDPTKTTIFIQSMIPEIAELTIYFLNLVTLARLQRNPTVKTEIEQKGFGSSIPAGFFMYPVSQAADILAFLPKYIPVGEDQLPMIEQTNEIARTFNRIYKTDLFSCVEAVLTVQSRLLGTDGKAKMSKSLNNAIYLSDDADTVAKKVRQMYTDPNHIRIEDPGSIEGNVVFTYLDIFDPEKEKLSELKTHYQRGGLGDTTIKNRLIEILNTFLEPMRARRKLYENDRSFIEKMLKEGTEKARARAEKTMSLARTAMQLNYF